VLDFVRDEITPYPTGNGHPASFAWVNSPPAAAPPTTATTPERITAEHSADSEHSTPATDQPPRHQ